MAFTAKIDNTTLTNMPSHWRVVEAEPSAMPTAGYGKIIHVPLVPGRLEWRWGDEVAVPAVVAELRSRRGSTPHHMVSWTKETGDTTGLYHRNVVIPIIAYGQAPGTQIDRFTLAMECYRPSPALAAFDFWLPGTIATGDGQAKILTPAGGRIIAVDGYIDDYGSGTGQTRVQVSNSATDYLSTRGDFVVASATSLMENAVLAASPTFNRGETLELDIDAIPSGSDSSGLQVVVYAIIFPV